jgi:tetratricopeptide (TPR) repeat protein
VKLRLAYIKDKIFLTPNDSIWLAYCNKTLKVAQSLNYKRGIALSHERLGIYFQYIISNHFKALEHYQKAISVAESEPDLKKITPSFYGNIGLIYYEQQDYKKAINTFRFLLDYPQYKTNCYLNMANAFTELKAQDSASVYFNKAIRNAEIENNTMILALAQSNLSLLQTRTGQNLEALQNTVASLELVNKHQLEFLRASVYANASMAYLANNKYDKAEFYATEALKDSSLKDNTYVQKSIWGTLADVYEKKGAFQDALNAHKKFVELSNSLAGDDKKLEIAKRDIQFENDKKQALAQSEIERQKLIKNGSIIGGSGLIMATLMGFVLYYRKRNAEAQKQEAVFNAKVSNTELKALRAQMNPHFIFNALNSINDFISKNDAVSASHYLTKFAKIMRQTLENSTQSEISLAEDLRILELYLQIETMRLKNKFTYSISVDEAIDVENTLIPPLILQPFIENSIWHGISKKETNGHIQISIKKETNMLVCIVDDNGIGRNMDSQLQNAEKKSLGSNITKSRIDIINKKKNTNGTVTLIDKKEGFCVEVRLPLQLAF